MSNTKLKLQRWFEQHALVKDIEKGYIVASELNILINTDLLQLVVDGWRECLSVGEIDAIVALPDAASRFAAPLAIALGIPKILPAKKRSYPKGWEDLGEVVEYEAETFTGPTQEVIRSFIGGIHKGMRLLIIDDVAATGSVGAAAVHSLKKAGVDIVGFGVIFDKQWQKGVERIEEETGIKACSLITVESISTKGKIILKK